MEKKEEGIFLQEDGGSYTVRKRPRAVWGERGGEGSEAAFWPGHEHLGQRKGVKSLRNGRDFGKD